MTHQIFILVFFFVYLGCCLSTVQGTIFTCKRDHLCGCSGNNVDINTRIIGGETVASHSWGWAVSIQDENNRHICGGTILSRYYILTAANCVENGSTGRDGLRVAFGIDYLSDIIAQRVAVSNIYVHPEWNSTSKENDIAMLKIQTPLSLNVSNIARICLPELIPSEQIQYPLTNSPLIAIGWGDAAVNENPSDYLQQVTLRAVSNTDSKCQNVIKNVTLQFCAAADHGIKDTCKGDSGGPLMYFSKDWQRWILLGVTSYRNTCANSDNAGIYARVTVYIDWIKSATDNDIISLSVIDSNSSIMFTPNNMIIILFLFLNLIQRSD